MYPQGHAEILRTLVRHGVDFIMVEGMAGALQGAPVHTQDIDIVHARTAENIERLLAALRELDAWFRMDLNRKLAPRDRGRPRPHSRPRPRRVQPRRIDRRKLESLAGPRTRRIKRTPPQWTER